MTNEEWIDSLKNGGIETEFTNSRENIIKYFILYYKNFEIDEQY